MNEIPDGVAHVSFLGGGLFLPGRTPYDRQMLAEHVIDCLHTKSRVQVLLAGRRWIVQPGASGSAARCARCAASIKTAACALGGSGPRYCLRCALDDWPPPASSPRPAASWQSLPST